MIVRFDAPFHTLIEEITVDGEPVRYAVEWDVAEGWVVVNEVNDTGEHFLRDGAIAHKQIHGVVAIQLHPGVV